MTTYPTASAWTWPKVTSAAAGSSSAAASSVAVTGPLPLAAGTKADCSVYDQYYATASAGKGTSDNINGCYAVATFHEGKRFRHLFSFTNYLLTVWVCSDGSAIHAMESFPEIRYREPQRLCFIARLPLLRRRWRNPFCFCFSCNNDSCSCISIHDASAKSHINSRHIPNSCQTPRPNSIGHRGDV